MLTKNGLSARIIDLRLQLKTSQNLFNDLRNRLKLCKKEITDTQGAIKEVEKLLLHGKD